jgi:hypothetical protein
MPKTSPTVDQMLRKYVTPVLKDAGFERVNARNGWLWSDKTICVFNIRAVGRYFSDLTGYPPGSVGVRLGAYYTFIPEIMPIKLDLHQQLLPAEWQCHMRTHLHRGIDQPKQQTLSNPAEHRRTNIWWVEPDGSNAEIVAADIASSLSRQGLPWYSCVSDLHSSLSEVEMERDSYYKFARAAFLSREIADVLRWEKYVSLTEAEGKRIGKPPGRWLTEGPC